MRLSLTPLLSCTLCRKIVIGATLVTHVPITNTTFIMYNLLSWQIVIGATLVTCAPITDTTFIVYNLLRWQIVI